LNPPLHRPALRLALTLAGVVVLCLAFGWWQNRGDRLGGPISTAKVLWLASAIGCFFVIPAVWWRDAALSAPFRRLALFFLAGFVARAMIEAPVLVLTAAWRCWHGLAHDAVMLAWLIVGGWSLPPAGNEIERCGRRGVPIVAVALVCEMVNAWLFQSVARPQDGVYFAGEDSRFVLINRLTWLELAVLWPALVLWIARYAWSPRLKSTSSGEAEAWL